MKLDNRMENYFLETQTNGNGGGLRGASHAEHTRGDSSNDAIPILGIDAGTAGGSAHGLGRDWPAVVRWWQS